MDPFRYSIEIKPRLKDLDIFRHVNNAVYLTYLEEARVAYCQKLEIFLPVRAPIGFVVAGITFKYKAPVAFDETIQVKIRTENFKSRGFEFVYRLQSRDKRRVVAYGRNEVICWDIKTGRPAQIPQRELGRMQAFEEGRL